MTWEEFVKKVNEYGYEEHDHISGEKAVWKRAIKGKYANGEDIIVFSPAFSKDGKVFFTSISYKENVSYEHMLKIIDVIENAKEKEELSIEHKYKESDVEDIVQYTKEYFLSEPILQTVTTKFDVPGAYTEFDDVECCLTDYYVGDWWENGEDHGVEGRSFSFSFSKKVRELIIDEICNKTRGISCNFPMIGEIKQQSLKGRIDTIINDLRRNGKFEEGKIFAFIGSKQWKELEECGVFQLKDVRESVTEYNGVTFILDNNLPLDNNYREIILWNKSCVGLASGKDWNADSTYNEERGDNFLSIQHSLGVKVLNPNGCYILYDIEEI